MGLYPKLRGDLAVSCQQTASGSVFVLKDPASGRFFRLREHEYLIAQELDGRTNLETIRRKAQEQLGVPVEDESLSSFVHQLDDLRLLETSAPRPSQPAAPRLWGGNLLHLRFKTFDPDRLLTRGVSRSRVFFTPAFITLSAATIVIGLGIAAANADEIWLHLRRLYRFDAIVLAWFSVLAVTVLHEFAHGLTCKYFGGQVREMGLMLLYFQPAMYCNVSDAWLFPKKSQRLWVTFAGGYVEAFLWSLATIAWRTTDPDTFVNFVALVIMATSGIKLVLNTNPLIKLDGYYLLSDYLEIPNLRQRSFAYIRALIERLTNRGAQPPDATPRERRIYLIYGLLAGVYSAWLLGWLSWQAGEYLLDRYQAAGLLAFLLLLTIVFRRSIGSMVSWLRGVAGADRPRPEFRGRRWATLAICALGLALVPLDLKVNGGFTILPAHNADVRAEVEGIIAEIYIDEGDTVARGRLLVRLSDQNQGAQLAAVDGAIQEKRARLKLLHAGPRQEEIELARAGIATALTKRTHAEERYADAMRLQAARHSSAQTAVRASEERVAYAHNELKRFTELFEAGLVSRSQLEERQQQARVQQSELERARDDLTLATAGDTAQLRQEVAVFAREAEEAEGQLKVLLAGSRREDVEATEAEIAQLEARRNFLSEQLRLARVVSPADGVVVTPRLKEKVGQHVNPGDLIAEVYELKTVTAEIAVSEKDVADVRVNAPVSLKARAYPERTFNGTVAAIAPAAMSDGELGARVFRVRVNIDNAGDTLKPEMTGTAKISGGRGSLFTMLTRRLARVVRVEFWSWW